MLGQSQVVLDTPIAIAIVAGIVTPLAGTVAKLYTNLVTSYERQLADRDARISDLKEQLERSNRLADESSAALRESIREGHRALTIAKTQTERQG